MLRGLPWNPDGKMTRRPTFSKQSYTTSWMARWFVKPRYESSINKTLILIMDPHLEGAAKSWVIREANAIALLYYWAFLRKGLFFSPSNNRCNIGGTSLNLLSFVNRILPPLQHKGKSVTLWSCGGKMSYTRASAYLSQRADTKPVGRRATD